MVLIAIAILIWSLFASSNVKKQFAKYSEVSSGSGLSAEDAGERILRHKDVYGVVFSRTSGVLTDAYSPKEGKIYLSESVYGSSSVAAIAVAAHECGHAIQDSENVWFYRVRQFLAPVAGFCSNAGVWLSAIGMLLMVLPPIGFLLMYLGIAVYGFAFLFYLIMVPVELDASKRAMKVIEELQLVSEENYGDCKKVLKAAGNTYVAALASSAITLLRLVSRVRSRR